MITWKSQERIPDYSFHQAHDFVQRFFIRGICSGDAAFCILELKHGIQKAGSYFEVLDRFENVRM
jgi:hypothetical protein